MMTKMEQLETLMGSMHILVDDWDRLGWEFITLPTGERACSLCNYTEAKAEGGDYTFTLIEEGDKLYAKTISSQGSGPHGVAWWDGVLSMYADRTEVQSVEHLAQSLINYCHDEGQSYYWTPWRDGEKKTTLLFKDQAITDTTWHFVEVPHPGDGE